MIEKSKIKNQKSKIRVGFTLIELLIVIVIIGALAAIFFANYLGVRQRARDSKRKSDLGQIQAALELYRYGQGIYPTTLYSAQCPIPSSMRAGTPAVIYMNKIPCDANSLIPSTLEVLGDYHYRSDGSGYTLGSCIENTNDTDPNSFASVGSYTCKRGKWYLLTNP